MVWNSRADKLPPPSYFSTIVAYLQASYRGARISQEMMRTLRPFFIEAWRNGKTAESAAQSTCSCDGKEILPSPVVGVHLAKGSVRPPKGAQRGEVFGADALRPPASIERLEKRLGRIAQEKKKAEDTTARWQKRAQTARKDAVRQESTRKQEVAGSLYARLSEEAQRVESEIRRLRTELNRTSSAAAPPAPPSKPVAQPAPVPPAPRREPKPRKAAPAATPAPSAAAQSAAMLSAIQGLLPSLAGQLSAEMNKETTKK